MTTPAGAPAGTPAWIVHVDARGRYRGVVDAVTGRACVLPVREVVDDGAGFAMDSVSVSASEFLDGQASVAVTPARSALGIAAAGTCAFCQTPLSRAMSKRGRCQSCLAVAYCGPLCHVAHWETVHHTQCPEATASCIQ